jgi:1-deoxy-D-xylulose-5-phosphate reductoisomerase
MKRISILGSTGSIGKSALNVVALYPEEFQVVALAARENSRLLYEQCQEHRPEVVALLDADAASELRAQIAGVRVLAGLEGVIEVATHPDTDMVLSSISGAAGLVPTHKAILEGKSVALANKETLVMAGDLLIPLVRQQDSLLIPVDSEHAALHQCLRGSHSGDVRRLILTASGGPFLRKTREELKEVSVSEALNHPTWEMGQKITIDSATLMNKGLEVIEAHHLFGFDSEEISVLIHPQSIVHSLVEFVDGTMLAQVSITDMRSAILYALSYPKRLVSKLPKLDLLSIPDLNFSEPDTNRFPCLKLAYDALAEGQTYPAVLNAANEVAVGFFLQQRIPFTGIPEIIEEVLERHVPEPVGDLETLLEVDRKARTAASRVANQYPVSREDSSDTRDNLHGPFE